MNRLAYLALGLLFLSCNIKEPIAIKENISDQMVLIDPGIKNHITKDSIPITIPIEFTITQNTANLTNLDLFFLSINGKRLLDYGIDYQTYDKQNPAKPYYFSLDEKELASKRNNKIIVRVQTQMISREKAVELVKKYKGKDMLKSLKINGCIKLIPYNRFSKDNPDIIQGFRKINDSIVFVASLSSGKDIAVKKKINW